MAFSTANRYSLARIEQINAEAPIRIELAKRAGGDPYVFTKTITHGTGKHKTQHELTLVTCIGGTCEICGEKRPGLEPHEKQHRGNGGKLSLENSVMVCRQCHNREHGNRNPRLRWI